MDSLLPRELLLLSQAVALHGTAHADAVASAMQPRMAASRLTPITSQACIDILNEMLAAEGLDPARLPELKRPHARTAIRLARKYYAARLAELRNQLTAQEDQMRQLTTEEKEIQSGAWDAKLTGGYDVVAESEVPEQALYKHRYSAGTLQDAQQHLAAERDERDEEQPSVQPEPLQPKEEAASPAKELHFADEVITMPDSSNIDDHASASPQEREGTATSTLQDVPEEDEEGDSQNRKREEEEDEGIPKDAPDNESEAVLPTSRQTRRSVPPPAARASSVSTTSKGSAPERRSSSRVSRNSIANLSEIIPSTSSDAAEVTIASPDPVAPVSTEEVASPSRDIALSSESMDLDITSMPMDREDSKESAAGPTSTSASGGISAGSKRGRAARKSSVPPVTAKDPNKRKRTTTPQAQNKATSPIPSERSRSKRIKTEEPESGLGTPVDSDRTPGSSDASAIRRFRNSAPHLISQMISSVNSTYFKEPVKQGEAKNYFEIIKKPMDLKTLLQSVKNGKITNSAEFTRDLTLIFANAIMYNGQEHHVGQDAVNMWREAQGLLRVLEAAEQRAM